VSSRTLLCRLTRSFQACSGLTALLFLCAAVSFGQNPPPAVDAVVGVEAAKPAAPRAEPAEAQLPAAYFAALAKVKSDYGLFTEAVALYRTAMEREPKESQKAQYELGLAQALFDGGRQAEALAIWKRLGEGADPSASSWAQMRLAMGLAESGRGEEAAQMFEKIALDSPLQVLRGTAARRLGELLAEREDRDEKLQLFKDRLMKQPERRELLDLVLALQEDDPDGRIATLGELLKLKPHDPELTRLYGEELLEADRLDDAEKFYLGVMRDYPEDTRRACEKLAEIASLKEDPAKAEEWVMMAVRDFPAGIERSLYLARQEIALELWGPAEKNAREAYNLADGATMKAAAAIELGEALCRLGRVDEAKTLLKPLAEQSAWRGLQTRARGLMAEMERFPPAAGPERKGK